MTEHVSSEGMQSDREATNGAKTANKLSRFPVWRVLIWTLVAGLLLVLGFGLVRRQEAQIGVGEVAPDFSLKTFDDQRVTSSELRGKVVVVNFWASWCKPCEQEAAELEQASRLFRDQGVVFVGVNYVDTRPEALAYLDRFDITYPNGPDLGTKISQHFRIRGVPETYVIDRQGHLRYVKIGPFESLDEISAAVEAGLAQ